MIDPNTRFQTHTSLEIPDPVQTHTILEETSSFGLVVISAGVSTAAIAERIDAKETVEDLAADYGVTTTEIEQAVLFERAA